MFFKHSPLLPLAALTITTSVCCRAPEVRTTTDVQMEKMAQMSDGADGHLRLMADNAILHDMSVVDFHFVPHTSELSGTGVARLDRMAPFLDTYGGTVRYDTALFDDELTKRRLDHVREYLALTGCDMSRVEVTAMISGGRGGRAKTSIKADDKGPGVDSTDGTSVPALLAPGGGTP